MNRHAKLVEQYCRDWLETDKPWERWQYLARHYQTWNNCTEHPAFSDWHEYRRKPRTILINGIEVPEPEREPLENNQEYFMTDLDPVRRTDPIAWDNHDFDKKALRNGLIHLTKESAKKHAEALLSFTKQP